MSQAALEAELNAAYTAEAALYRRAVALAECLATPAPDSETVETKIGEIAHVLTQVQQTEDRLAPVKARWRDAGCTAQGALAETLTQVASLIRQLHTQMDRVSGDLRDQQQALAPLLDEEIRRHQMRRAYGDANSTLMRGAADGR